MTQPYVVGRGVVPRFGGVVYSGDSTGQTARTNPKGAARVGDRTAMPRPETDATAGSADGANGASAPHATTILPLASASAATNGSAVAAPRAAARAITSAHWSSRVTVEGAIWALFLVAAVLTRFWDLGSKTLHHDESLHAYYSWGYATGVDDYVHHPLMHGPFLFHANALVYLLLGASDASSRYVPALFGVALVGLPYFLRGPRHLGRWGALAASALLLISPSLLYQSRYIRHDIYTVVGALVLFIGIVRYLERPERRWLVTAGAALGFLLTNHEIVFGIVAIFVVFLWGTLLWGRFRPLVPLHLLALALAGAVLAFSGQIAGLFGDLADVSPGGLSRLPTGLASFFGGIDDPLPAIPWKNPTRDQQNQYYADVLTHPLILGAILLVVLFVVAARLILTAYRDPDRDGEGWLGSVLGGSSTGSVERGVLNAWRDRAGLLVALGVGAAIFVVLYTSLFSNMRGLTTGTYATDGTLFYWLGQHNYRRGNQPWFYYLVLFPQYEFFGVLFGVTAVLLTVWQTARRLVGRGARRVAADPRLFFRLFLVTWFVSIFAVLSWAGEKMPWLVTHITLPATLLAASLIGELMERAVARRRRSRLLAAEGVARPRHRWVEPGLVASLLVAGGCWFFIAGRFSYGQFLQTDAGAWERTLTARAFDRWWLLALPPAAAMGLLAVAWAWRGARRTGWAGLAALAIALALLQVHAAWRTVYLEADVPKDMLVYTQSTPDISRMVHELELLSEEMTGGREIQIWVDTTEIAWPLQWYLRDFPNRTFANAAAASPPATADVVLVSNRNKGRVDDLLAGYTAQGYVLRWWFPEYGLYREFAIAPELSPTSSAWKSADNPHGPLDIARSIGNSLSSQLEPAGQQRLYRLLMYRDLPKAIDGEDYTLYVRNDLIPLLNGIRY